MLVGPSGGGKSVLIIEAMRKLNENLAIVKSTTTREKRSVEDELFYDFVDFGDFLRKEREREDKARAKLHITYQKEIINSFKKGGKEKATEELINYIKSFVR